MKNDPFEFLSEPEASLGDRCGCFAYDADTGETGWRPCPGELCERDDHTHEAFLLLVSEALRRKGELEAEIDRLRSALEFRTKQRDGHAHEVKCLRAEVARLSRNGDPDYSPDYQDEYQRLWHEARAEVARLEAALAEHQQAGDALAEVAAQYFDTGRGDLDGCVDAWRALRGGGQEQDVNTPEGGDPEGYH